MATPNCKFFEEQLNRIDRKLELARKSDPGLETFGAGTHRYEIREALPLKLIEEFENTHGIEFPPAYRAFLERYGIGKTGPGYGLFSFGTRLDELVIECDANLGHAAKIRPDTSEEEWGSMVEEMNALSSEDEYASARRELYAGLLPLGSLGCCGLTAIVVTGEFRGRIVYASMDDHRPDYTSDSNFLDWYEGWLDEILSRSSVRRTITGRIKRFFGRLPEY